MGRWGLRGGQILSVDRVERFRCAMQGVRSRRVADAGLVYSWMNSFATASEGMRV